MDKIESLSSGSGVTKFLDKNLPEEGKKRHELIDLTNAEAFQKAQVSANKGDIWATLNIITGIYPFKEKLDLENESDKQKRYLLIVAAQQREAKTLEPTMRYATFISTVDKAQTIEEILHAMPVEWIWKIPSKDPLPRSVK